MLWRGGRMIAIGDNQLAAAQAFERKLNGAFGETGSVGDSPQTHRERFPFLPHRLAIKININQIGGWMLIVSDQIAHQHIDHVIVDGNGSFETGHETRMKVMAEAGKRNQTLYR